MNRLPLSITLSGQNTETAIQLYDFLQENRQNPALIPILNMDLTFISPHAKSMNDFVIDKVEYLHNKPIAFIIRFTISSLIYARI